MSEQLRNAVTGLAPPIVASPAKRIQAFTGDPDFMASLEKGEPCSPTFREALETQAVCEGILSSAKKGVWETIAG